MVTELIGKYVWLIRVMTAAGDRGLSLEDLSDKHSERWGGEYSRRTFNNHRQAIEDIFGISIRCDRSRNRYYIPFSADALDDDDSLRWLVNTFTVNNLLALGKERLSGRVAVEEIPSGQKHLTAILQAMEDGAELEVEYAKYKSSTSEVLHIQPFAVKEHERRWYLVGFCWERALADSSAKNTDRKYWRVYGLDRILGLKETGKTFKLPKGFSVEEIFSRSYGIFFPHDDAKARAIRFRATEEEAKYLRDLPLHQSQKEERCGAGGPVFTIRVIPNPNLVMEFCKRGDRVEVLEPQDVRDAVASALRKAADQYGRHAPATDNRSTDRWTIENQ